MSRRRITKQQHLRIKTKQERYYQQSDNEQNSTNTSLTQQTGLVIRCFGRQAEIQTNQNQRILCSVRAHIETIVAGDIVIWQETTKDHGVILSCTPRHSVLTRPDRHHTEKPIAANISQMMIVVAPIPEINWLLLDSYLVMAEIAKIKPCIILNKVDLPHENIYQEIKATYTALGYTTLTLSHMQPQNYSLLEKILSDQISVFVGQSGVGKSSIVSKILPQALVTIASISDASQLGRHTTTNSQYYHLPTGGALIDSPGIRSLHLGQHKKETLITGFKELKILSVQCKFSNCNHSEKTPQCAIQEALSKNKISPRRFHNFLYLINHITRIC